MKGRLSYLLALAAFAPVAVAQFRVPNVRPAAPTTAENVRYTFTVLDNCSWDHRIDSIERDGSTITVRWTPFARFPPFGNCFDGTPPDGSFTVDLGLLPVGTYTVRSVANCCQGFSQSVNFSVIAAPYSVPIGLGALGILGVSILGLAVRSRSR